MIFSSWQFFLKMNERFQLYYNDTSGWLVFVLFWKKLKRHQKYIAKLSDLYSYKLHLITSLVYVRASLIPYKGFQKHQVDTNIGQKVTAFDQNNRNSGWGQGKCCDHFWSEFKLYCRWTFMCTVGRKKGTFQLFVAR